MAQSYKLTKVTITNYKGIASQAFAVGPGGAILAGPNGAGKTSARDAVVAALASKGVDPSCIREGADSSEILVNLEGATVRRRITASGATATVTNAEGDKWGKPQSRLDAIFGSMLDPLKFFLADKKEQRRLILEACPVEAPTAEDFARWLGELAIETLPNIEGLSGLEAVEKVRKAYYDRRTSANKEAADAKAKADAAVESSRSSFAALPKGAGDEPSATVQSRLDQTRREHSELLTRDKQAKEQAERSASTRDWIANLRAQADTTKEQGKLKNPTMEAMSLAGKLEGEAKERVRFLEDQLDRARKDLAAATAAASELAGLNLEAMALISKANELVAQADDLEASLTAVAIEPVTAEEIERAAELVSEQENDLAIAKESERVAAMIKESSALKAKANDAQAYAEALDKAVDALTNIAPRELMTRSNGIPGLALTEDGITLDGRNIANLCGAEKMAFAVEVAKRANDGGGKLLCVDGLEALDEKNREAFVRMATADGWQLLGTLVSGEDLHVIELK